MEGRYSLKELSEKTPMHYERAREFLLDLKAENVVHISAWRRDALNRASIAIYTLGVGVDAPKPAAKTPSQRTRKYKTKAQKPLTKAPTVVRAPASVFDLGMMR
jgi:hypothetical protein